MRVDTQIAGKRVRLVPYLPEHVERYSRWMQDTELLRLTGSEQLSLEEERENQQSWHADSHKVTFIICALGGADGATIDGHDMTRGMCGDVNAFLSPAEEEEEEEEEVGYNAGRPAAAREPPAALAAEIEIMIADPARRRGGLAREALLLFLHWLLEHVPHIERLCVKISDDNTPSFRLFEGLGFCLHKKMAVFEQTELRLDAATAHEKARLHWTEANAKLDALPSTAPAAESSTTHATSASGSRRPPLRVLVLSYEFTFSPFSGNGVLARSLVKGLLAQGASVVVLCCQPTSTGDMSHSSDLPIQAPEVPTSHAEALCVRPVVLPATAGWKRLDRASAHSLFAEGAAAAAAEVAGGFGPSAVLAIDWTGGAAWRAMREAWPRGLPQESAPIATLPPPPPPPLPLPPPPHMLYINFRVYSSGLAKEDAEASWYDAREVEALASAEKVFALSAKDKMSLQQLLSAPASAAASAAASAPPAAVPVEILLPCLRGDLHALAEQPRAVHAELLPRAAAAAATAAALHGRCFVTCAVRLSSEKNPLLFVRLVEAIGAHLGALGLVPLLCGASADAELAREVKSRLRAAAPSAVILDNFLGAAEMAGIFAATRLNVHPCLYDAYGMSVVEAAAFGAPTLLQGGGAIGATALLNPAAAASAEPKPGPPGCLEVDLSAPTAEVGTALLAALKGTQRLDEVAEVARGRALGWSEGAAGKLLYGELKELVRAEGNA